jgi:hypothetical protein
MNITACSLCRMKIAFKSAQRILIILLSGATKLLRTSQFMGIDAVG